MFKQSNHPQLTVLKSSHGIIYFLSETSKKPTCDRSRLFQYGVSFAVFFILLEDWRHGISEFAQPLVPVEGWYWAIRPSDSLIAQ